MTNYKTNILSSKSKVQQTITDMKHKTHKHTCTYKYIYQNTRPINNIITKLAISNRSFTEISKDENVKSNVRLFSVFSFYTHTILHSHQAVGNSFDCTCLAGCWQPNCQYLKKYSKLYFSLQNLIT